MESCEMGQPRPRKRGKKSVNSCPSFSDSKTKAVRGKIKIAKKDPPPPPPPDRESGGHMNVRDLGNYSGQVKPSFEMSKDGQKRSSYKGEYGDDVARVAEIGMARRKKK